MASASMAEKNANIEHLVEEMQQCKEFLKCITEKIANIELRQSHSSGECTDAIRAFQQWASAESASLPEAALKAVAKMIKTRGKATYADAFVLKDVRRGQFEMFKFYEKAIRKTDHVMGESQHSTGECFTKMPCTRDVLRGILGEDVKFEELPEVLVKLYKLVKPMDRRSVPTSIKKMIELKLVPEDYKGHEDLDDKEAAALWSEITMEHGDLKFVETIPLSKMYDEGYSWHEKLVAKIVEYNKHYKMVSEAAETIFEDIAYQNSPREDKTKKAQLEHDKKMVNFWSEKEATGTLKIERAMQIKKKWAEEYNASQMTKVLKKEHHKDEGEEQ
jgi:hypothetical protein